MRQFFAYFSAILTRKDKWGFVKYIIVLFVGSISSVLGIGAILPFVNILIQPDKIQSIGFLQGYSYQTLVIISAVILIVAFWLKNAIATFLLFYQSKYLGQLINKVQIKLFGGYMQMPYEYHLNCNTPTLIRNINNETNIFSTGIVNPLGMVLTDLFSSTFVVIALLFINPIFTGLILLFTVGAVVVFLRILRHKASFYGKQRAMAAMKMSKSSLNALNGIKETKLYHLEKIIMDEFSKHATMKNQAGIFSQVFQQSPKMLIETVALTVIMIVISGFILMGNSSQTMLVILSVFGVAAAQLLPSMNRMTQSLATIRYSYPALKTIYYELKKIEKRKQDSKEIATLPFNKNIHAQQLSYTYMDGTVALNDVAILIERGKKTALVGRSGAGKTTLVDLLMGLYNKSHGQISVDGKILESEADILSLQKLFGYIPQSIILYDQTISENIALGVPLGQIDNQRIWECLAMAQLSAFVKTLPLQEQTFIGENGVRLSGGQRQRIGIARALYRNPQILVMDEATSSLDNETESGITGILLMTTDLTMITIAHHLTTIKNYDVIYVMDHGRIIDSGEYNTLLERCEVFRQIIKISRNIPSLQVE